MRAWRLIPRRRLPSFNFELLCAPEPACLVTRPRSQHWTLGQLHHVIQVVMGWADEHLHTFSISWQALRRRT
ncbi:IS1096 element passenger TnpR family protein [Cupriavidus sp. H39]|uniref:IS1096 element passenger TnpR family protein n=1 Tax=Cupriavidus sp. H39 TaxID=3401635 RepID=UPI003D034A8B